MKKVWIARDKYGLHLFWGIPELTPYGWDLEGLFENRNLNHWADLPADLFPEVEINTCAEFEMTYILNPGKIPYKTKI